MAIAYDIDHNFPPHHALSLNYITFAYTNWMSKILVWTLHLKMPMTQKKKTLKTKNNKIRSSTAATKKKRRFAMTFKFTFKIQLTIIQNERFICIIIEIIGLRFLLLLNIPCRIIERRKRRRGWWKKSLLSYHQYFGCLLCPVGAYTQTNKHLQLPLVDW